MVATIVFLAGCALGFGVGFGVHEFAANLFDYPLEETGT